MTIEPSPPTNNLLPPETAPSQPAASRPDANPPDHSSAWRGRDVALISAGGIAIFILGILLMHTLGHIQAADSAKALSQAAGTSLGLSSRVSMRVSIEALILECVALVGSVYPLGLLRRHLPWSAAGVQNAKLEWYVIAAGISMVAIPLVTFVMIVVQLLMHLPNNNTQLGLLLPEGFTWLGGGAILLLAGLAVPFAEELFFRGLLFSWLRQYLGFWIGALASSLVFALLHGELILGISAFLLGLAMAWVYDRSRSIWPAVIIHALNNSLRILLLYLLVATGFIPIK